MLAGGVLGGACASPSETSGRAILVTLHDYRGGTRFELASESHSDPVAYYSDPRTDASRKIQTDEIMSAFLRQLDALGFGAHARVGPAPAIGTSKVVRWGLEAESKGGKVHWLIGTGSKPEEWKAFQDARDTFLAVYNRTVSYQAVENESGREFFEDDARATPPRESPR